MHTPEVRARVARSQANALTCLPACSNAPAVVDRVPEVDRMLRPAAREVAAAAARKTLPHPHEAKDGSPATCWKSCPARTGKALWIRLGGAPPWRVSGRCGTGWPGAPVDDRPSAGHCRCAWPAKMTLNSRHAVFPSARLLIPPPRLL